MRARRWLVPLLAATAIVGVPTAVVASTASTGGTDTLVVASVATPPTLDPDNAAGRPQAWEIINNLYDAKIYYQTDLQKGTRQLDKFVPRLFTSWQHSDDFKTWTFELRKGVKSNLGNEMTAADFKWTWQRAFANNRLGALLGRIMNIESADQVKTVGRYTVRYELSAPSSLVESITTLVYHAVYDTTEVKKHITSSDPWANDWLSNHSAGYGAYYAALFQPGQQIVLKANPNYYPGVPKIKTVVYRAVPEAASRAALLRAGDADIALSLAPEQLNDLKKDANVTVSEFRGNGLIALLTQFNNPTLKNYKVRLALAYATPYDQIMQDVYKGYAETAKSYMPPIYPGYTDKFWPFKTDYEKAKQLLKEAGVQTPLNLTLTYAPLQPTDEQVAIALKSSYAKVGVNVDLKVITPAQNGATLAGRNFELMFYRLISHVTDPVYTLEVFDGQGKLAATNWVNYKNRIVDTKFDQAQKVIKWPARLLYAKDIQRGMASNPPFVVMGATKWVVPHRKNISGLAWMPQESLWFHEITKAKS